MLSRQFYGEKERDIYINGYVQWTQGRIEEENEYEAKGGMRLPTRCRSWEYLAYKER